MIVLAFLSSWSGDGPLTLTVDGCVGQVGVVDCTSMDAQLAACQRAGKRVLLSLGGAAGAYGLADDAVGVALAGRMWRLFFGGEPTASEGRRPWLTELDGIDLDVEAGTSAGYAALVSALRWLMDADRSKVRGRTCAGLKTALLHHGRAAVSSARCLARSRSWYRARRGRCQFRRAHGAVLCVRSGMLAR